MTAILRLQLDDKDPVRVNSAINQLAEVIDRGGGGSGGRTLLTANTTYYVATTGSDTNSGTSVGSPFLTIQHAYDVIARTIDTGGFTTTIQCASGTYAGVSIASGWTGGGRIILDLGGGTISAANCVLITATLPNTFSVQNGTMVGPGNCLNHAGTGILIVGTGVTFGAVGSSGIHMVSQGIGSKIQCFNAYAITGGANVHYAGILAGNVIQGGNTTVTISGTITINTFAFATLLGSVVIAGMTYSGSTPTGQRFQVDYNSIISTNGGGANYFPGTIPGPTTPTPTGGQYQ
jgi:hypothetical protein